MWKKIFSKIPFREIWILYLGMFSGFWLTAFRQENPGALNISTAGIIMSILFTIIHSYKWQKKKETTTQLKNARRMAE
jgi:hypothetical protein